MGTAAAIVQGGAGEEKGTSEQSSSRVQDGGSGNEHGQSKACSTGREVYICAQSLYATDPPHQIHVRFDACGGDRRRLRSRAPLIPHRARPACLTTWPAPRSPVPDLGKGGNSKFGGFKTPVVGRVVSYYVPQLDTFLMYILQICNHLLCSQCVPVSDRR